MLYSVNFNDPVSSLINIIIILFILLETYSGFKKGFLESTIRFIGFIAAIIGAYILKNPISVFLYTKLPFFKFSGLFKGVSALNILVYEAIAFFIVFILLLIVLAIIGKLTGLVNKLLTIVFIIGVPNKILGAIVGFIESFIILYFIIYGIKIASNMFGYEMQESLADDIISIPILSNTFGNSFDSLEEITSLAKEYEDTKDKDEFNSKAINILLKYDIITEENLQILINSGKITIQEGTE